jgi:TRAP-type C4-dicarboxylate transport system substrate-binding protein
MMKRSILWGVLGLIAIFGSARTASAKDVKIKLGTLAPEGSPWHNIIKRMGQRMKDMSGGKVTLAIYPGGVAGDEGDMVRKMRVGQLHAATITNIGLSRITRATVALQIPMTIQSYEELDYVRDKIGPKIAAEMEKQGFIVLNWGDAGWVHFFSKTPAQTPDDFRKLKLYVWNGDPESERAWKVARFQTVPLSSTDVLSSLSSGMVDSYGTTPLFAETSQWYGATKYMVAINWTPLNGATIVTKKQWEEIEPAELREKLHAVAIEEGHALNQEVRALGDKSVKAMVERGLKVTNPDAAVVEEWRKTAEMAYPEIRGKVVPAEYFDEVLALVKDYREHKK